MQHNNIDKVLLEKYILNECTPEEVELVIKYFQSATNADAIPSGEDVLLLLKAYNKKEEVASNLTFDLVLKVAKRKERTTVHPINGLRTWHRIAAVATVFIGFLYLGYFFWQNQADQNSITILENSITLELGDGSIEILSENGTKKVVDKMGSMLGQQKGSQISYEDTDITDELVYNSLTVPYGKRFEIKLSDGTLVHLNAGTSLRYPVKFLNGQQRKVFLTGEAYFEVSKDTLHPFVVNTNKLNVRVLGTQFNISSYPEDQNIDVVLVEGSVAMYNTISNLDNNPRVILEPGFKGVFEKDSGNIKTKSVVTNIYTSWINGELVYRNTTFNNILRKLERHYNVKITNYNDRLADEVFNASYGKISLNKVLEDLKLTYGIDYDMNGSNITIK